MTHNTRLDLNRRDLLALGTGTVLVAASPLSSHAEQADLDQTRRELFGMRPVSEGRVTIKLPPIAENGYSVPLSVEVDSPMTEQDFVKRVAILSPRNPLPLISQFYFSPGSGRAKVDARIRMSGTQSIQAIAEMNDGSLWSGSRETVVTLAACVVL